MDFALYATNEYFAELAARIAEAGKGDRVVLVTMILFPKDPTVRLVLDAMEGAARRGASVSLIMDANTFLIQRGRHLGPLFFHGSLPPQVPPAFRPAHEALSRLRGAGVTCAVINQPGRPYTNPIKGRSHIKFSVVNDRVYIGGCNLDRGTNLDIMTAWDDKAAADWLADLAGKMIETGSTKKAVKGLDLERRVGEKTDLLVDAGVQGRSLIFETALQLIDEAEEHVTLACQFFPDDPTVRHLLAAHKRGVKVKIFYNQPRKHLWPHIILHTTVEALARLHLPRSFFAHAVNPSLPYLHAKLIATEKGAMLGSHNFVKAGVSLGTAEISLVSRDPDFARRAEATIVKQVTERSGVSIV